MNLHGSLEIQVDAQVAYSAGSLDEIVVNACGFLWDLMLPTARRTPQHLSLRGVELELIAAHPRCDVVHTRRHLSKNGYRRRMAYTIYLSIDSIKVWAEVVTLDELNKVNCVQQKQDRSEDRPLRNFTQDHCWD